MTENEKPVLENYDSLDLSNLEDVLAETDSVAETVEAVPEEVPPPAELTKEEPPKKPVPIQTQEVDLDFEDLTGMAAPSDTKNDERLNKPWMRFHKFRLVQSGDELDKIVDLVIEHGSCALDLETEGLDSRVDYDSVGKPKTRHQIVGVCIAVKGAGYYIPVRHKFEATYGQADPNLPVSRVETALQRLCQAAQPEIEPEAFQEDPLGSKNIKTPGKVVIKFWNAKFDQEFLYPVVGIDFWHPESFEDGMLARYSCYTDDWSFKLKDKAAEFLSVKDPKTGESYPYEMIKFNDMFGKEWPKHSRRIAELYPEEGSIVTKYGCSDAICTDLLTDLFVEDVQKLNVQGIYRLEKQAVQVVRLLERNRTLIDAKAVEEVLVEARIELETLVKQITKLAHSKGFLDFNPASPKQLSEFLFTAKGLDINPKPKETDSGQFKTDSDTLEALIEQMQDPPDILQWVIYFRQIQRVIGTYLERFLQDCDEEQQLRFNFNQIGAATGRFTAPAGRSEEGFFGGPIQGIPARNDPKKHPLAHSLRRVFIAHEGYTMVKADYAGQELRIVANVSGEPLWINEFQNGTGDLHTLTAKAFFNKEVVTKEERNQGKCVHPSTLVYLDKKLAPLESLPFSDKEEEFLPVKYDIYDGADWRHLHSTFNGGVKPLLHVVTTGGILTCTSAHKFKTRAGKFIQASDLQEGDLLQEAPLPQITDSPYPTLDLSLWDGIPPSTFHLSHNLSYFAGLYAGDGTGSSSSVCITHGAIEKLDAYGNPYEDWVRHLEASCAACGFTTTRKDFASLYLGSRVFVKYLQALGMQRKREKNLRIPPWVLAAGRTAVLHYLGGLMDTDGTVGAESRNLDWTTKDFVFAGQVAAAMRACGLDFNVELTFNKTYQRYYVRQRLTVGSSWEMRHYMRHPGKLSRLREPSHAGKVRDRFLVTKILPAEEGPCVDISVEESHVYVANGMVTHNTANFALIYGGGIQAIQRATGVDKTEAARKKTAFDKSVPTFARWLKGQHVKVKKELGIWTAFRRWVAIPDANIKVGGMLKSGKKEIPVDVPLMKKIVGGCERKSVNYPIQGTGADIMKISLVRLAKEFHKNGWLKNGDDSVRMLMTIHDELVFEIKHHRLEEAIPLLCELMESPYKLVGWKVPLIVEPLVGRGWDAKYDWVKIKEGKEPVPDWLTDHVTPGAIYQPKLEAPKPALEPKPESEVVPPTNGSSPKATRTYDEVAVFSLSGSYLTEMHFRIIGAACMISKDPDGKLLQLTDDTGAILIAPSLAIRVNPTVFSQEMRNRNLGHGRFEIVPHMGTNGH